MGITHVRGLSVRETDGYNVGAKGSERKIIDSSGYINLPLRNASGTVQFTSSTATAAKTSVVATSGSLTLTTTASLAAPANFVKYSMKSVDNAATKKITMTISCDSVTATKKATATKATGTGTLTGTFTGSPAVKLIAKFTSAATGTAKATIAKLSVPKFQKLYINTAT